MKLNAVYKSRSFMKKNVLKRLKLSLFYIVTCGFLGICEQNFVDFQHFQVGHPVYPPPPQSKILLRITTVSAYLILVLSNAVS